MLVSSTTEMGCNQVLPSRNISINPKNDSPIHIEPRLQRESNHMFNVSRSTKSPRSKNSPIKTWLVLLGIPCFLLPAWTVFMISSTTPSNARSGKAGSIHLTNRNMLDRSTQPRSSGFRSVSTT